MYEQGASKILRDNYKEVDTCSSFKNGICFSSSWVPWELDSCSCCLWPYNLPHSGCVNTVSHKELCRQETCKTEHYFLSALCTYSCFFFVSHISICIHGSEVQQHCICITWHSSQGLENLLSLELDVCLFTESKHKKWAQEMGSGKSRSKAEAKSGILWCVSSHGKLETLSAGPNQWHLLEIADEEGDFVEFVTISGYIPAAIGQRECKELLNPLFRNKIKYLSLCHGCRGQKAELIFGLNNSSLPYTTRGSQATVLMQ